MPDDVKARLTHPVPGTVYIEHGIDYTDGYRVTVGWSVEDTAWLARVDGCAHASACLADGQTKETALLALVCSTAATLDAVSAPLTREQEATVIRERVEGMTTREVGDLISVVQDAMDTYHPKYPLHIKTALLAALGVAPADSGEGGSHA